MLIQQLCKSFPATLLPKENEFVEHDQHLHLTIPTLAKPVADRNDGAALWRKVPRKTAENAKAVFAFVRDPLDRFASGWREMRAYERGPAGRRGWGKVVLRQQPFYANATDVPGVANVFGGIFLSRTCISAACIRHSGGKENAWLPPEFGWWSGWRGRLARPWALLTT